MSSSHDKLDYASTEYAERIRRKIRENVKIVNDCWIWQKSASNVGYAQVSYKGRSRKGHRVSYEVFKGEILAGEFVLHSCDVKLCVNPDHLRVGTQADNWQDMRDRNRIKTGKACKQTKLTPEQVREIRKLRDAGMTQESIGDIFNVSHRTVGRIEHYQQQPGII